MTISAKQREVLAFLRTVEQATLEQIYQAVSFSYYCNYEKHLGSLCSRLVKSGHITRVKPGTFKLGGSVAKTVEVNPKQMILL
jgi:hypothetical protein